MTCLYSFADYSDTQYIKQAEIFISTGKTKQALKSYQQAAYINPHSFTAHYGAAKLLCAENQLDESLQYFDKAFELRDQKNEQDIVFANALLQLGNKLFLQHNKGKQAAHIFRQIISINDCFAAAHHNLAFTLAERLGKYHEALTHYHRSLELNPNNHETHFCYALACLATGNLQKGWKEYLHRWQREKGRTPRTSVPNFEKKWKGEELSKKTIIILCEQGLGDTLQFIRYAQLLKNRGAYVIAEVQKPLIPLLSLCRYIDEVIELGQPLPSFDYLIPMLDLPEAFNTSMSTIPIEIPYLTTDKKLDNKWRRLLKKDRNFKIGICWYGDDVHGQIKFMPLKNYIPLMKLDGVSFYSIQKISGLDQLKNLPEHVVLNQFDENFDVTEGSFMDTASVMKQLDLVITADTSIAHLAGGLGIPTWIILPYPAEWRWLMKRNDSPWYPTVRLFRQKKVNKWKPVTQELLATLKNYLTRT